MAERDQDKSEGNDEPPAPNRRRMFDTQSPADNALLLIHQLSDRITRAFSNQVEARHNLTLTEWRVIMTLKHFPGCTAIDITERWSLDKMAVNRAVKKLQAADSITRARNPADRRSFNLTLTEKGEAQFGEIVPAADARYREIASVLERKELSQLNSFVVRLIQRAEELDR